jgi:hypothetical protein
MRIEGSLCGRRRVHRRSRETIGRHASVATDVGESPARRAFRRDSGSTDGEFAPLPVGCVLVSDDAAMRAGQALEKPALLWLQEWLEGRIP